MNKYEWEKNTYIGVHTYYMTHILHNFVNYDIKC